MRENILLTIVGQITSAISLQRDAVVNLNLLRPLQQRDSFLIKFEILELVQYDSFINIFFQNDRRDFSHNVTLYDLLS